MSKQIQMLDKFEKPNKMNILGILIKKNKEQAQMTDTQNLKRTLLKVLYLLKLENIIF